MDELDTGLDTSTTEDSTTAPDTGSSGESDNGEQPQPSTDWRAQKYGDEWESSVDYWKDTNKYLRGELDKAKKARPARGIEDHETEPRQTARPQQQRQDQPDDDLDNVQSVKDLVNWWDKQAQSKFETILTQREKQSNFRNSMAQARTEYVGDDILPSFQDLEQDVLMPLVQQSPQILQLLRELPNPGQAAYTLGILLKAQNPAGLRKMFASQGREELLDKINETTKQAVRVKQGRSGPTTAKLTPEQITAMPSDEFERLVAKNTGRAA